MPSTFIASDDQFALHKTGLNHPESPERYNSIKFALLNEGLQTTKNTISPKKATLEDILLCHTSAYFSTLRREVSSLKPNNLGMLSTGDVILSEESLDVALLASGAVLKAVDALMEGKALNVFCNVRPPGHHACSNKGMGFCLFNNVAIGARYAQKKYGIKRVAIIDWDLHHGNGTQEIFYGDPSIFYFSTHQEGIYPGTGFKEEKGCGTTLNCPIKAGLSSQAQIFQAFDEQLLPAMERFQPELVLISAGFDAHQDDPLGSLNLTSEDFGELTKIVLGIANKFSNDRLVSVLEGGYNLRALSESVVAHVKALKGAF
jgi:acetoin utilization deacetylase AcuC-like enzyme